MRELYCLYLRLNVCRNAAVLMSVGSGSLPIRRVEKMMLVTCRKKLLKIAKTQES